MALTTQDLVKGIDITGETDVGGSQLNQLVDTGRLGSDKGMVIETTDTAEDTPVVPDPNNDYSGVTPTWWTKYIWKRILFDDSVILYKWDESEDEDEDLLFWIQIDKDGVEALATANTALANAATAQNTADTAQANVEAAQADIAQNTTDIATNEATLNSTVSALNDLNELVLTLWSAGDIKYTTKTTVYSTVENQGWVECDGSSLDRTEFADLFAAIGTTFGSSSGTTFKVPDFKGRTLVGAGTGAGLTARSLGLTNGGEETHLLTGAESGTSVHAHPLSTLGRATATGEVSDIAGVLLTIGPPTFPAADSTANSVAANASSAHQNMPPFGVARIIMKT